MVSAGEKYEDQRWPLLHLFVLNLCCGTQSDSSWFCIWSLVLIIPRGSDKKA